MLLDGLPNEPFLSLGRGKDDERTDYIKRSMKRRGEPASVEDASEDTDSAIPNTRRSATHTSAPSPKRKRPSDVLDRSKTKSATGAVTCNSRDPIPLLDAVRKFNGPWPMTFLSGGTDRDAAKNEISGYRLRKLFYEGTLESFQILIPQSHDWRV